VARYAALAHDAVRVVLADNGRKTTPEEVEDLVQDTFLSLLENDCRRLRAFNPANAGFATWISILARRRALDFVKRRRIVALPLDEALDIQAPECIPSDAVDLALPDGVLSPRERVVIESLYLDDLSVGELEKSLGVGRQAIYNIKYSGINKLRRHFRSMPPEEGVDEQNLFSPTE
jgi:RNA polymerase sigma-70 factor (ECF subfamily)